MGALCSNTLQIGDLRGEGFQRPADMPAVLFPRVYSHVPVREVRLEGELPLPAMLGGLPAVVQLGTTAASGDQHSKMTAEELAPGDDAEASPHR